MGFREFVRGFVVDPELERKAHEFINQANSTAKRADRVAGDAQKLVGEAKRKLRLLSPAEALVAGAVMFIGAGVVIGTLASKVQKEDKD